MNEEAGSVLAVSLARRQRNGRSLNHEHSCPTLLSMRLPLAALLLQTASVSAVTPNVFCGRWPKQMPAHLPAAIRD